MVLQTQMYKPANHMDRSTVNACGAMVSEKTLALGSLMNRGKRKGWSPDKDPSP